MTASIAPLGGGLGEIERRALAGDLADDAARGAIDGVVVLATCNRVEIYLDAARFHDAVSVATSAPCSSAVLASRVAIA